MTIEFEPYFLRWDSVLFYPDPSKKNVPLYNYEGEGGSIQCYQHKLCGALVRLDARVKYPPRVCPHCHIDTTKEEIDPEQLQQVLDRIENKKRKPDPLWIP